MILSLIRRLVSAVCLLWIISLLAFWLSKLTPGDEVMEYLNIDDPRYNINSNPLELRSAYQLIAHRRGLDLPSFYWSISPGYFPDSVNFILPFDQRSALQQWIRTSGSGESSMALYNELNTGILQYCTPADPVQVHQLTCQYFNAAIKTKELSQVNKTMLHLEDTLSKNSTADTEIMHRISRILSSCKSLLDHDGVKTTRWLPLIRWNGTHNQYHQWMSGLIAQRPLTSLVDGLNAWSKIYDALKWTLVLNGFALLLAILLGVLIGIWSGAHDHQPMERIVNWLLFALFALPSFWLGTLFIYALTSGEWVSIFPSGGLGAYQRATTLMGKWSILFTHLFLPVMCLALGALAYVSRQMKQSILHQLQQPYVRALRAQGISERSIMRKHVVRNALFPVITIIGGSVPALVSGSLIIEVIYSIPGMGRLMYNSLLAHDWPVVFPVLMLGAAITVFSYVLTDIVYKWADPRVKTV